MCHYWNIQVNLMSVYCCYNKQ